MIAWSPPRFENTASLAKLYMKVLQSFVSSKPAVNAAVEATERRHRSFGKMQDARQPILHFARPHKIQKTASY